MFILKLSNNKKAIKRLAKAQYSIEKFSSAHPGKLNKRQHKKLQRLLNNRANALSKATGFTIHSICD